MNAAGAHRAYLVTAIVLAVTAAVAFVAGSAIVGVLLVVLGVVGMPLWAMLSAARRQQRSFRSASHEAQEAWRDASGGHSLHTDVGWR